MGRNSRESKGGGKAPGEFVAQGQPVAAQGTPVQPVQPVQHSSVAVTVSSLCGNGLPAKEQAQLPRCAPATHATRCARAPAGGVQLPYGPRASVAARRARPCYVPALQPSVCASSPRALPLVPPSHSFLLCCRAATHVKYHHCGESTWIWCIFICCFAFFYCKTVSHECAKCKRILGKYRGCS